LQLEAAQPTSSTSQQVQRAPTHNAPAHSRTHTPNFKKKSPSLFTFHVHYSITKRGRLKVKEHWGRKSRPNL